MTIKSDKKIFDIYRYWSIQDIKDALAAPQSEQEAEELRRILALRQS